ncbi:hypothetical protein FDO65_07490 [Nakamurella flava]|uniref:Peptidase S8/S53 domain-containing protein n=1 Tax=Nakamurella flava TaxID=2576308 RepID=A0A4U6QMW0_9ACTN|nr:S8 family serine peptidase [Nakamurella flava]TKV61416.1 hypothetical protein FDO65_07490 [Nakamurella flava]
MAWWTVDRGRRTGRRLFVVGAVAAFVLGSAPASAREPSEPAVPSVVTFQPVGSGWREVQDSALAALPGPRPVVQAQLATGNVLLADLTADQRRQLAARPEVLAVAVDAPLATDPVATQRSAAAETEIPPALPPTAAPAAACTGTADRGQLEPQALDTLRVRSDDPAEPTAASLGYDGAGVTVGILTTAFDPDVPDFRRPDGSSAVVDYRSYVSGGPGAGGTALEGFGDVSAIVAQGAVTHDLATVVNPAAVTLPDGHCWIRIVGAAPGADVIGSNIYDGSTITVGAAVRSIDDAVAAGADVLSQSFGFNDAPDASLLQAIVAADAAAINAGVTVVASSGDAGANSTIIGPAADPRVIAVGASIDGRLAAQVGAQGLTRFGNGAWPSGTSSVISSSGFSVDGGTVDLLAPGDSDWSVCTTNLLYTGCLPVGGGAPSADVVPFGGTSQSAPFVAGVAALVIQAYRDTHAGTRPTPDQVQRILTGTAADLGLPAQVQGSGLVDAHAAVLAARSLDAPAAVVPAASPPARTLIADAAQQTLTGTGRLDLTTQVTNTGSAPVVLDGSAVTRDVPTGRQTFPIAFDAQAPTFTDGSYNLPMTSTRQTFTVEPGAAQIDLAVAGVPQNPNIAVYIAQLTVLDPSGAPVAYASSSSGLQVKVPRPAAGEWTAVVQAPTILDFRGELSVQRTQRQVIASVQPDTAVLLPGATTTLRSSVPMPGEAGDAAATLRVADQLALPVVLRVPVDLSSGAVTLGGTARPQNGRGGAPSQQTIWEFDVPAGHRSVDVSAVLDAPAQAQLTGVLIGPDGLARSTTSNTNADQVGASSAVDQSVVAPEPGRWRYVLGLWGTSWSAPATAAAFRVSLALDGRRAAATGLPAGETLTGGTTRTVTLSLDNPGPAPLSVAVDARTDARSEVDLPVVGTGPTVTLPIQRYLPSNGGDALPRVVVPPFSSRLSVSTRSTVPVLLAAIAPAGSPAVQSDVGRAGGPASTSTEAVVTVADAGQAPGPWSIWLMPPGPTTAPTPDGSATVAARVETAAYDPTVTDATGQPFVTATGPAVSVRPTLVPAGGRFAVPVTLPVRGAPGDRVSGFLALTVPAQVGAATDQLSPADRSGDVLAVFRYAYTVAAAPDPSTTTPPTTPSDPSTTTPVPDPSTTVTVPTVSVPTVTIAPVTIAPVTLAPLTVAAAAPVVAPQRVGSAVPTGSLPVTGVDVASWVRTAVIFLLAGGVLVTSASRMRRSRRR